MNSIMSIWRWDFVSEKWHCCRHRIQIHANDHVVDQMKLDCDLRTLWTFVMSIGKWTRCWRHESNQKCEGKHRKKSCARDRIQNRTYWRTAGGGAAPSNADCRYECSTVHRTVRTCKRTYKLLVRMRRVRATTQESKLTFVPLCCCCCCCGLCDFFVVRFVSQWREIPLYFCGNFICSRRSPLLYIFDSNRFDVCCCVCMLFFSSFLSSWLVYLFIPFEKFRRVYANISNSWYLIVFH